MARSQQLELAAQDLANLNTTGYRSQQTSFRTVLARSGNPLAGSWTNSLNGFGVLGETRVTRNTGNLSATGNPLDFGLEGDGFFAVQTQAGVRYTRNGQFRVSPAGLLINQEGAPVLGTQGPITLPQGAVSVSGDGTISVAGALVGKLRLVQFGADVPLKAEGASSYVAPAGAEQKATGATLRQGMVESSNVNPVTSAIQLVALQRTAQMLQHALSTFHSEFDRVAVEELPKV